MNIARDPLNSQQPQKITAQKKKKRKGNAHAKRAAFHRYPNGTLILFLVWYLILIKYFVNFLFSFFKQILY